MDPIWFGIFAFTDGTILAVLAWVVRELLRWRRMTDQHNMMWREFATNHDLPFNPDRGNGVRK